MVYIDDIGNLEDLLVLINGECGNPKAVFNGGKLTRNINQKKKPDVHSGTNAISLIISSISIWNIGNQFSKYDYSCASVVNNFFLIK